MRMRQLLVIISILLINNKIINSFYSRLSFKSDIYNRKSLKLLQFDDFNEVNDINADDDEYECNPLRIITIMDSIYLNSEGNSTKLLLDIIDYGDRHFGFNDDNSQSRKRSNNWVKVSGCMSNVWIGAKVVESNNIQMVSVDGEADSRIARGMLAIIIQGFYGCFFNDLTPSAFDSIRMTPFYRIFPTSRINGFANMLSTIQSQIFPTPVSTVALNPIIKQDNSIDYIHLHSPKTKDIAVLLSGGVDSSLALKLAQESGMNVNAFYLKIWLEDELAHLNECPWEEDMKFAEAVTSKLGVQLDTVSLQKEYWSEVVSYTLAEAKSGRTPNPDIMCNSRIKFGMFYEYVGRYFNHVATGHYAQVIRDERGTRLITSPDEVKDQTYFLSNLRQDQLSKAMFPIGHLSKPQVRVLSKSYDLPTQLRKDSQGICFLGKLKFDDFIRHYLGDNPGAIRCYQTNQVLGHHRGLWYHTIGQRKGIGLLLNPNTLHLGPYYVASKDMETNTLYVTNDLTIIDKPRKQFTVQNVNWILDIPKGLDSPNGAELKLKLRHSPTFVSGRVKRISGSDRLDEILSIELSTKDKGIASGQFAAFYDNNVCLGAGVIADLSIDSTVISY